MFMCRAVIDKAEVSLVKKQLLSWIELNGPIFLSNHTCCDLLLQMKSPQPLAEHQTVPGCAGIWDELLGRKTWGYPPAGTRALGRRVKAGKKASREDVRPQGWNQNRNKESSGTLGPAENYLLDKSKKPHSEPVRPIRGLWISVCVVGAVCILSLNWLQNKPKSLEKTEGL